jgi:CheY-like chemotaxis protein
VLVADDSTEFAEMLRATLEEAGFEVVTAYSGPAALPAMGSNEVDAAVLDVLMVPGIAGDAIADRLRRLYPQLRSRRDRRVRQVADRPTRGARAGTSDPSSCGPLGSAARAGRG